MKAKLRIARATGDLAATAKMYKEGLDLSELASFNDHLGFDGVILGLPGAPYHFEFTTEKDSVAPGPRRRRI